LSNWFKEATLVGFSMGGGKWFASVVMAAKEFLKRFLSLQLRHFNCKQTQIKVFLKKYDGMAKLIKEDRLSFR
jgi:hypothetical protein